MKEGFSLVAGVMCREKMSDVKGGAGLKEGGVAERTSAGLEVRERGRGGPVKCKREMRDGIRGELSSSMEHLSRGSGTKFVIDLKSDDGRGGMRERPFTTQEGEGETVSTTGESDGKAGCGRNVEVVKEVSEFRCGEGRGRGWAGG